MVNTKEIMDVALKLSGFKSAPADSAIHVEGENVKKALFGLDAGVGELLLAKKLGYDAVIAHHPQGGSAIVDFYRVFSRHITQMVAAGIPKHAAERAVRGKMNALKAEMQTRNYDHTVDVARLLKMPFLNIHTPLDELGRKIMASKIKRETSKDATVGDVVSTLEKIPEFACATTSIAVHLGNGDLPAGKIWVSHGAGTNGGYEIAKTYFEHGINTLIYIHINTVDLLKLKADEVGTLIVTGHVASDSVGINPFIAELKKKGVAITELGIVPRKQLGSNDAAQL